MSLALRTRRCSLVLGVLGVPVITSVVHARRPRDRAALPCLTVPAVPRADF